MPVVPDSSPLIVLSKLERVDLLAKLYGKAVMTPAVWDEAINEGKAMGARDAAHLEKFALENQFDRAKLSKREKELARRLREDAGIGSGESEVLAVSPTSAVSPRLTRFR